ncbi:MULTISPECIES: tRNA pseudouridine(13) synthase TruD [unclassified Halomonas]|uniref:tRNA pseudouridine(13) synthase TruD n=1 Tax=unclassified Halomonas TaxID=2609666 RepID=UPI00209E2723|nr:MULTISPECIES: tRNA pseudouridine(13) synthase TruD [unclassified Halomonas]MCP1313246.1 tRNA pseudouridine(13) synthase TruD [Halomonas sp. 707D7]MCP1327746.1 tRNA pseudouridine(13) synthase TruD [Halomonas sp. 707D4]
MSASPWTRSLNTRFDAPLPGEYRRQPEDFVVDEQLDFTPEGSGEHLWLRLEKRRQTTLEVVKALSQLCDVGQRDVGYSGMKDRFAVTRQWFSVHLPGREAPQALEASLRALDLRLIEQGRHPRKLKRGVHRTNRFRLRLRGEAVAAASFETRWEALCAEGVPNYFGPQRFGAGRRNLERARALLEKGWRKRDDRQGMMLSTARSFLFNEGLSARIDEGTWATPLAGDTLMLDGTQSVFTAETADATLEARAAALDLHPTGPLWGVGGQASGAALALERMLQARHPALCDGLVRAGVSKAQRSLRARVIEPSATREGDDSVVLEFSLPRGSFATSLVGELIAHPDFF